MAKITKDTLIVDCLKLNPNSAEILLAAGMHCIGCAMFTATIWTSSSKSSTRA